MADPIGIMKINDSDSEELKRQKINGNFQLLLSGLTTGLGNGATGTAVVFGAAGLGGSTYGYYNAVRDRLEVDRLYADHLETRYMRTDFLNVVEGATIAGCVFRNGTITADSAQLANELTASLVSTMNLGAETGTFSTLTGVQINADTIVAGTISFDSMVFADPETGRKSMVRWADDPETGERRFIEVDRELQGGFIADRSLNGNALVAHSVTADEITADNIVAINGRTFVNLNDGTFEFVAFDQSDKEYLTLRWGNEVKDDPTSPVDLMILRQGQPTISFRPNMIVSQTSLQQQSVYLDPEDIDTVLSSDRENKKVGWAWIAREAGDFVLKKIAVKGDDIIESVQLMGDR